MAIEPNAVAEEIHEKLKNMNARDKWAFGQLLSRAAEALASLSPAATSGSEAGGENEQWYAVIHSDYSKPFAAGVYQSLEAAQKAQVGKPDRWQIFTLLPVQPASSPAGGDVRDGALGWNSPEEWEIEQRAFHAAGRDDVPKDVQELVAILWKQYCIAAEPSAALSPSTSAAEPVAWIANCCHCGRVVDTREEKEGGDKFGCELTDGRWTCSPECWDAVVEPDATPPAPAAVDGQRVKR